MKLPVVIINLSLSIAFANALLAQPEVISRTEQIESELSELLTRGSDVNPLDRIDVQIDGCYVAWRGEYLSRQCQYDWTVYANTSVINLTDIEVQDRHPQMRVTLLDDTKIVGADKRVRSTVEEFLVSIDALVALDIHQGKSSEVSEFCDKTIVADVGRGNFGVSLVGDDAADFENLLQEVIIANNCTVGPREGIWDWLKSLR